MIDFITNLLQAGVTQATPLLLVVLGEIICERSGVLNLGLEGMMLMGAFFGFLTGFYTHSLFLGCLAALAAGALLSAVHAVLSIKFRANQIISGLALTIFGTGLTAFLGTRTGMDMVAPRVQFRELAIPFLDRIPILGKILFQQDLMVYGGYLALAAVALFLHRTRWGLNIRSVGENPAAADVLGINVGLTRYLCVLTGGALAGLGGAYLAFALSPGWKEGMSAGRGWVAIALVIFGSWNSPRAALGALLFGTLYALDPMIQARGTVIPTQFLQMLPYALTILFLIISRTRTFRKSMGAPEALALPYKRGSSD